MNSESQSLKVVAGVFAALATVADIAHSQQIPSVPNGRRNHWPGSGPHAQGVGVCRPARAKSPLKTPINRVSAAAVSGPRGRVKV
jgi:hypothetical protein